MNRVFWISAAVIGGMLAAVFWLQTPSADDAPQAGRLEAATPVASGAPHAPPLPLEEPEPEPVRDFPAAATSALDETPIGEARTNALRTVFREWAEISPEEALAWIATMEAGRDQDEAREFVCYRVAEDDPKRAFDLARQAGADTATPLIQDLAQQWTAVDAASARDWALALPAGEDRDALLARICQVLSKSDPLTAGTIVSGEIAAGPVQEEAAMSVLHQWAIRDPAAAAEWIAEFPEGPLRTRAEAELAGILEHQASATGIP